MSRNPFHSNSVSFLLKVDSCQQHQGICIGHGCLTEKHSFQTETQVDSRQMCFVVVSMGAGRGLAWEACGALLCQVGDQR